MISTLALAHDCGIDVEGILSMTQFDGVGQTVFSADELDAMAGGGLHLDRTVAVDGTSV